MKLAIASILAVLTLLTGCGNVQVRMTGQPTYTTNFPVQTRPYCVLEDSRLSSRSGPNGRQAKATDIVKCRWVDQYGRRCESTIRYTSEMVVRRTPDGRLVTEPEKYQQENIRCGRSTRRF